MNREETCLECKYYTTDISYYYSGYCSAMPQRVNIESAHDTTCSFHKLRTITRLEGQ